MIAKPKQWGRDYAEMFEDACVAAAYRFRPPYPLQTYEILHSLLPDSISSKNVLDAGCGAGAIARVLAPLMDRVDAVDCSIAMIEQGRKLPGGDHPNLHWICNPIETAPLQSNYSLIVAAASLHWMEWHIALPRFADHLNAGCHLALVEEVHTPQPWDKMLGKVIGRYSLNKDFQAYTMLTIAQELEQRGLFTQHGIQETEPMTFRQPVEEWIESFHARNGLSQARMGLQAAYTFDSELEQLIRPYTVEGVVEIQLKGRVVWGKPAHPTALTTHL